MGERGEQLAFIVGHYRSGSTWLLNALSLHPAIRGLHETHIFYHASHAADARACTRTLFSAVPWSRNGLPAFLRRSWVLRLLRKWRPAMELDVRDRPSGLLDFTRSERQELRHGLEGSALPDEYCRFFFEFHLRCLEPGRYLLEKTPDNVFRVAEIKRLFRCAKLIAIYRDGRDVVVSDRFFKRHYSDAHNWSLEASIRTWRAAVEAQIRAAESCPLFACSYESLQENGQEVLRRVLEFLDLSHNPRTIEHMLRCSSFRFRTGRDPGQESQSRFARKGVSGDWRGQFGNAEKRLFKDLAGDLLIGLGYERDLDW